jgi:hypothetical protein
VTIALVYIIAGAKSAMIGSVFQGVAASELPAPGVGDPPPMVYPRPV